MQSVYHERSHCVLPGEKVIGELVEKPEGSLNEVEAIGHRDLSL